MQEFATRIVDAFVRRRKQPRSRTLGLHTDLDQKGWFAKSIAGARGFTAEPNYCRRQQLSRRIDCLEGELFVALIDVRPDSPSFLQWQSFVLSAENDRLLEFPAGVACGWQVVSEWGQLRLMSSKLPDQHDQRWLRWNDFTLQLPWPEIPDELAENNRPSLSLTSLQSHQLPHRNPHRTRRPAGQPTLRQSSHTTTRARPKSIPIRGQLPGQVTLTHTSVVATSDHKAVASMASGHRSRVRQEPAELRILLLGCNGQLGRDLHLQLRGLGTVIGGCREPAKCPALPLPMQVDVTRPASVRQAMRTIQPSLVINATGLTDVAQGEQMPRVAQTINATAPRIIVDEAERLGCGIIHFCSSQVFDGSGEVPWTEESRALPINQVGRTKLVGTEAILASRVPHLVLRSSWLYSPRNRNFVTECVDQLGYRNHLTLACDHTGTPTPTRWIAQMLHTLLTRATAADWKEWMMQAAGLYHLAPLGFANRLVVGDQLMATCRSLGMPVVASEVRSSTLREIYPGLPIPANQCLGSGKFSLRFGVELPRWQPLLNQDLALHLGKETQVYTHVA